MASLRGLDHRFRRMAEAFVRFAVRAYPGVRVTSARRSWKDQARLYAEYLAGRNNGLPALPPGTSDHEAGLAFDLARPNVQPFDDDVLPQLGETWLRWGGRWSNRDPVHFAAPLNLRRARWSARKVGPMHRTSRRRA